MSTKRIFLWSAPRCITTAFERSMMEVDNSKVFHQPFSKPYFFGPDRICTRYISQPVDDSMSYNRIKLLLTKEYDGVELLFSKDMAYVVENQHEMFLEEDLRDFQHTFLIRNPRKTLPSLYRASINKDLTGWDGFDPDEAGFSQLQKLYDFVKENLDENPVVVDADDLLRDPESTMKCECYLISNF